MMCLSNKLDRFAVWGGYMENVDYVMAYTTNDDI